MGVLGYKEFCTELDRIVAEVTSADWVEEACQIVQEAAKDNAPFHSGALKSSIDYEIRGDKKTVEGIIFTDVEWSQYVEFGTGPKGMANHDGIAPGVGVEYTPHPWSVRVADAPGLADYDVQKIIWNGEERFLLYGQAAHPFLYPALKDNIDKIISLANDDIDGATKG